MTATPNKLKYTDFIDPLRAVLPSQPTKAKNIRPLVYAHMGLPVTSATDDAYASTVSNAFLRLKKAGEASAPKAGWWMRGTDDVTQPKVNVTQPKVKVTEP